MIHKYTKINKNNIFKDITLDKKTDSNILIDIYSNLSSAIDSFVLENNFHKFLRINASPNEDNLNLLSNLLDEKKTTFRPLIFSSILKNELLGYHGNDIEDHPQILSVFERFTDRIVIIPAVTFENFSKSEWLKFKSIVEKQLFHSYLNDRNTSFKIKFILVGTMNDFSLLDNLEQQNTYENYMYSSINSIFLINQGNHQKYFDFISYLIETYSFPKFNDLSAYQEFLKIIWRKTGDLNHLLLDISWLKNILSEISVCRTSNFIDEETISLFISKKTQQEAHLVDLLKEDFKNNQILIETEGTKVGQINGLSIIDVNGYPKSIGEPMRISSVISHGEGEIIDIDHKADLAGNIHQKGMLIINFFLSNILNQNLPLPFNISFTIEQSHDEIDGDSASLAGLCVLLSSLSDIPLKQNIAVTGAIDQFGKVCPVGGINEKIESFYDICKDTNLNGEHGVIIPYNNKKNVCLRNDVQQAIDDKLFNIWLVDNVSDATQLLFDKNLEDSKNNVGIISLIEHRLDDSNIKKSIFSKIKRFFLDKI
ncbi:S16 family serine protease [Paraphotobacterium marinum]|nr:S16 family serine protease [Paraphotobacterium marinum]